MINANELRIGNIVNLNYSENDFSFITGVSDENISFNEITFDYVEHGNVNPILIKEEWLLNFGFKQQKQFFLFHKSKGQVDFNLFSWETPVGQSNGVPHGAFYILINGVILVLEYVHQLQNLYFALTGEELSYS